jgi:hypothetical protein
MSSLFGLRGKRDGVKDTRKVDVDTTEEDAQRDDPTVRFESS